jgi:hypothetical protein
MFRRVTFSSARSILFETRPSNLTASTPSSSAPPLTRSPLSAVCLDYGRVRVGVASLAAGVHLQPAAVLA